MILSLRTGPIPLMDWSSFLLAVFRSNKLWGMGLFYPAFCNSFNSWSSPRCFLHEVPAIRSGSLSGPNADVFWNAWPKSPNPEVFSTHFIAWCSIRRFPPLHRGTGKTIFNEQTCQIIPVCRNNESIHTAFGWPSQSTCEVCIKSKRFSKDALNKNFCLIPKMNGALCTD